MKHNNDIYYFIQLLNFGKLLGIVPINFVHKTCSSCYSMIIIAFYFIFYTYSLLGRLMFVYNLHSNKKHAVIDMIQSITETTFVILLISQSIRKYNAWKLLLKHIGELDNLLFNNKVKETPKYKFIVLLILSIAVYLTLNISDFIVNKQRFFLLFIFTNINDFYMTVIISFFTFILNQRICNLNQAFLKLSGSNTNLFVINKKLEQVFKFYRHCNHITYLFNKIFGWPIFLYIPSATIAILSFFDVIVNTHFRYLNYKLPLYFSLSSFYLVSMAYVVCIENNFHNYFADFIDHNSFIL